MLWSATTPSSLSTTGRGNRTSTGFPMRPVFLILVGRPGSWRLTSGSPSAISPPSGTGSGRQPGRGGRSGPPARRGFAVPCPEAWSPARADAAPCLAATFFAPAGFASAMPAISAVTALTSSLAMSVRRRKPGPGCHGHAAHRTGPVPPPLVRLARPERVERGHQGHQGGLRPWPGARRSRR